MISMDPIEQVDPAIAGLIRKDLERQNSHIHLIASENFASPAVMAASGSVFTNKYAEGYPGRRYYEGCQVVDEMEQLAIDRAKELFGAEFANVQAHSAPRPTWGPTSPSSSPVTPFSDASRPRRASDPRLAGQFQRPSTTTSSPTEWIRRPS
jgi:hypothetical protein